MVGKVRRYQLMWVLVILCVSCYEAVGSGPFPLRGEGAPSIKGAAGEGRKIRRILRPSPFFEASPCRARASRPLPKREGHLPDCHIIRNSYLPIYAQDTQRTVWDGVYNDAQARRGEAVFLEACSNCHGRSLEVADMTPALTGDTFMANWDGLTVGDLFDRIRISMPADRPGSLSRQEDADVVAYILRFNEFPSGKEELPREVQILKQILFKASRQ